MWVFIHHIVGIECFANVVSCYKRSLNGTHYMRKERMFQKKLKHHSVIFFFIKAWSDLSLLRKISCRMPISRSLWVIFSLLLEPGMTRLPTRVKGRGGVQGTLSSMVSWEWRRAISNVCLSIISSRLAASPKSLILLTFTETEGNRVMIIIEQNTQVFSGITSFIL